MSGYLVSGVFAAIAANVCYFLGPAVEFYLEWIGWNRKAIRYGLWTFGFLFSALVASVMKQQQNSEQGLRHVMRQFIFQS